MKYIVQLHALKMALQLFQCGRSRFILQNQNVRRQMRQTNSAILKVPDGALDCLIRILVAERLPWNLRYLIV